MSQRNIVIVGAGGFGREVFSLIRDINDSAADSWNVLGFVAEDPGPTERLDRIGARWLGRLGDEHLASALPPDCYFVSAIGNGSVRKLVDEQAIATGLQPATIVHPTAVVGLDVELGPGSVVCAGAILTTNIWTGRSAQINIGCTVGHDARWGDYVTLSPSVDLAGNVTIGDGATLYTKTSVIPGVKVGADAIVGAGSVVIRDVAAGTTVVGCPAREVRRP